jgi:FtsP/CotA-like multicopper oxidase with cupredoxin domain
MRERSGPEDNWTGLFRPGERGRLRFVNAGARWLSMFDRSGMGRAILAPRLAPELIPTASHS